MDDKKRLEKILEIIPERTVYGWVTGLNDSQGLRLTSVRDTMDEYRPYIKTVGSKFSNGEINDYFKEFNLAFETLDSFLTDNFPYRKNTNGILPDWFRIGPDSADPLRNDRKTMKKQSELLAETKQLANDLEIKYRKFLEIAFRCLFESEILPAVPANKEKFRFDSPVLRYGDIIHKFHKGNADEKLRLKLFEFLWPKKRYFKKGKKPKTGEPLQPGYLAVQLGIVTSAANFNNRFSDKKIKDKFWELRKGINRILKGKKFPAKIEREGGIQLVIKEK